mmetsp:Transcript_1559/g.6532  ORF Transcript_1559/g.6532 Transcript_1559/m.6532 type:complete len:258 (+) Transcript_1559:828-1601(+)
MDAEARSSARVVKKSESFRVFRFINGSREKVGFYNRVATSKARSRFASFVDALLKRAAHSSSHGERAAQLGGVDVAHGLVLAPRVAVLLLLRLLQLLHLLREQTVVALAHRARGFLDHHLAARLLESLRRRRHRFVHQRDPRVFVQGRARHHVQRRRDETDGYFDTSLVLVPALRERRAHRVFDVHHAVVREARQLDVRADLQRLRGHAPADILHQRFLHDRVDGGRAVRAFQSVQNAIRVAHHLLERLEAVAVRLV